MDVPCPAKHRRCQGRIPPPAARRYRLAPPASTWRLAGIIQVIDPISVYLSRSDLAGVQDSFFLTASRSGAGISAITVKPRPLQQIVLFAAAGFKSRILQDGRK